MSIKETIRKGVMGFLKEIDELDNLKIQKGGLFTDSGQLNHEVLAILKAESTSINNCHSVTYVEKDQPGGRSINEVMKKQFEAMQEDITRYRKKLSTIESERPHQIKGHSEAAKKAILYDKIDSFPSYFENKTKDYVPLGLTNKERILENMLEFICQDLCRPSHKAKKEVLSRVFRSYGNG